MAAAPVFGLLAGFCWDPNGILTAARPKTRRTKGLETSVSRAQPVANLTAEVHISFTWGEPIVRGPFALRTNPDLYSTQ